MSVLSFVIIGYLVGIVIYTILNFNRIGTIEEFIDMTGYKNRYKVSFWRIVLTEGLLWFVPVILWVLTRDFGKKNVSTENNGEEIPNTPSESEYGELSYWRFKECKSSDEYIKKYLGMENIKENSYQFTYDMSNDWLIDNPTWQNVRTAFEAGFRTAQLKYNKDNE